MNKITKKSSHKSSSDKKGRLGILAGRGELPVLAAKEAIRQGEDVVLFPLTDELLPDDLHVPIRPVVITKFFRSVISSFKKEKITKLLLLGKVTRDVIYDRPEFDFKTLYVMLKMKNQSDTSVFRIFGEKIIKCGIEILPQTKYLQGHSLPIGRYGKKLTSLELENVMFGIRHACSLNLLDIGQTVVVGNLSILAVEGAEGTDLCVLRGGELFHKKGAVVCKVAKRNHDDRFDLPVTGFDTLKNMKESGCRVLALESRQTFVLHPKLFIEEATRLGISLISLHPEEITFEILKKLNSRTRKI